MARANLLLPFQRYMTPKIHILLMSTSTPSDPEFQLRLGSLSLRKSQYQLDKSCPEFYEFSVSENNNVDGKKMKISVAEIPGCFFHSPGTNAGQQRFYLLVFVDVS